MQSGVSVLPEGFLVFPIDKVRLGGNRAGLCFWHGIGEVISKGVLVLERRVREHDRSAVALRCRITSGP